MLMRVDLFCDRDDCESEDGTYVCSHNPNVFVNCLKLALSHFLEFERHINNITASCTVLYCIVLLL